MTKAGRGLIAIIANKSLDGINRVSKTTFSTGVEVNGGDSLW